MNQNTLLDNIALPTLVNNVNLMSPGKWNGYDYTSEEIKKAFFNTDWKNPEVTKLFIGHPLNANNAAGDLAGKIINPRLVGDSIMGDLELWDMQQIINITKAKLKVGVSPRVISFTNEEELKSSGKWTNYIFDNFSIVSKPAQSSSYINMVKDDTKGLVCGELGFTNEIIVSEELAQITAMEEKRKQLNMSIDEFYAIPREPPSESSLPIFDIEHVRNALARFNQTNFKSEEEKTSAKNKINKAAKKFGIVVSNEMAETTTNDIQGDSGTMQGNKPAVTPKKKCPNCGIELTDEEMSKHSCSSKEEKIKVKGGQDEMSENIESVKQTSNISYDELSESELSAMIMELQKVLDKKKKAMAPNMEMSAMLDEMKALRVQVAELSAKASQPAPKTNPIGKIGHVRAELSAPSFSTGVQEMAECIKTAFPHLV